jgi:GT2 family glycosyltransferase
MHKFTPLLSIVICTFNTKKTTLDCLKYLKKSINYVGSVVEVIVVENGTDGTGKEIELKYPWVKVIFPNYNTGFAKGNNLGINASNKNSKYILLLNSDVMVRPETLKKSLEFMVAHADASVLGCKLIFANGKMQPSAGFLPTPFSITTWISGIDLLPLISQILPQFHPKHKSFFSKSKKVGWVMGAYFFAKREAFEKTGGFDENLFMYLEEVELCKRIKNLKMHVFYTPDFSVTHLDKGSQGGDNSNAIKKEIEGIIYYIKKIYPNSLWYLERVIRYGRVFRSWVFYLLGNQNRSSSY